VFETYLKEELKHRPILYVPSYINTHIVMCTESKFMDGCRWQSAAVSVHLARRKRAPIHRPAHHRIRRARCHGYALIYGPCAEAQWRRRYKPGRAGLVPLPSLSRREPSQRDSIQTFDRASQRHLVPFLATNVQGDARTVDSLKFQPRVCFSHGRRLP